MTVTAQKIGAGTGSDQQFSVSLWTGWATELTVSVLAPCRRSVLAFASIESLGNNLSYSASQIKLTAKENRLSKRSGRLNTFCFFPDYNKRLPSESPRSVSRPCVQARRDMTTTRMSPNTDPTVKIDANSTTATR